MRVVFVTCPPEAAAPLLRTLVQERLAAGGNLLSGVRSIYRWQGEVRDEPETVLLVETADDRVDALIARCRELHPYVVPKILAFPPAEGWPPYIAWVDEETRPLPPSPERS